MIDKLVNNNLLNTNIQSMEPEAERPAPLGIYYEICYPPLADHKKIAYRRQAKVHSLIKGRVSACLHMINSMNGKVSVQRSVQGHCHYCGVVVCGSVWACPVCSIRIAFNRAQELYNVNLTEYCLSMVTVTFSHQIGDPLKPMIRDLASSWREFRMGKPYIRQVEKYGIIGTMTSTETRYGGSGWHPHKHTLYLTEKPLDQEFSEWAADRWRRKASEAGRYASLENGLNVLFQMSHDAKTYITKLVDSETEEVTESYKWSLTDELTKGYQKTGKSVHPFQLLDSGKYADDLLFVEYVEATKGMKSLVWSPGLKSLLGVEEKTDEELAIEDEITDETLFMFDKATWLAIIRMGLRYDVLRLAERAPDSVIDFLKDKGIGYAQQ